MRSPAKILARHSLAMIQATLLRILPVLAYRAVERVPGLPEIHEFFRACDPAGSTRTVAQGGELPARFAPDCRSLHEGASLFESSPRHKVVSPCKRAAQSRPNQLSEI